MRALAPEVGFLARSVLEANCHPEEAESLAKRATPNEGPITESTAGEEQTNILIQCGVQESGDNRCSA